METLTARETHWRYYPPDDKGRVMLLLTTGGVLIKGPWGAGEGLLAWCPMPKRTIEIEDALRAAK